MANFNHKQPRDCMGRFTSTSKATALTARAAEVSAIKRDILYFADWIEPDETGKFPRAIIRRIMACLERYENILNGNAPSPQKKNDKNFTQALKDIFDLIMARG